MGGEGPGSERHGLCHYILIIALVELLVETVTPSEVFGKRQQGRTLEELAL